MGSANAIESRTDQLARTSRQEILGQLEAMERPPAFDDQEGDFDSPAYQEWMRRDEDYATSREKLLRRLAVLNRELGLSPTSMD